MRLPSTSAAVIAGAATGATARRRRAIFEVGPYRSRRRSRRLAARLRELVSARRIRDHEDVDPRSEDDRDDGADDDGPGIAGSGQH